ncbi:MAG: glutathione S-transferase family protein [Alphaproteobacteria bacterium]|nr:MAG: glutathione S-transferase family protein [Alphaproteobacteria bacterium]
MLRLYTNAMSRGRIARWMLEELGEPYEVTLLDFATTMKAPDYLALNPMGKVPTLVHDGAVVTEVAATCAYLADAFPQAGLAPPTDRRAAYYRWLFFAAGPVEQAVTARALGLEAPAEREANVGYGSFARCMDTLEWAVSQNEYIAGPDFTAADVYMGSQIGWGLRFGTIERRPAFGAYWARLESRPARLRAEALDNAALPKREE